MNIFIEQLKSVTGEYHGLAHKLKLGDPLGMDPETKDQELLTRALAAIERASGRSSVYFERANEQLTRKVRIFAQLKAVIGVAESLCKDMQSGYLETYEELIRADVFSDFLEMSDYLLSQEYKDATAVMVGSTLELHLKKLATKHSVATESIEKPKKANTINEDLVKAGAYNKLEQKSVTAWLDLRNKAAHGEYQSYDKPQVELMLSGVRDFVIRHPA